MKNRDQSKLASALTLLLGIWIAISPIWLQMTGGALASAIAVGSVIGVFSIVQYFWENVLPSWVTGLAAIWTFITGFVFAMSGGAMLSMILSAIAVFFISTWDGFEVEDDLRQHQHHVVTAK